MSSKADREPGAWIGQRQDENTERVREALDDGAERVAVTHNGAENSRASLDEGAKPGVASDENGLGQERQADGADQKADQ